MTIIVGGNGSFNLHLTWVQNDQKNIYKSSLYRFQFVLSIVVCLLLFVFRDKLTTEVNVTFEAEHRGLLRTEPSWLIVTENDDKKNWSISVIALSPGYSTLSANVTPNNTAK